MAFTLLSAKFNGTQKCWLSYTMNIARDPLHLIWVTFCKNWILSPSIAEEQVKSTFGSNIRLKEPFSAINNTNSSLIGKLDNLVKYNVLI